MNISFIKQLNNIDKASFEKPIFLEPMSSIFEKLDSLYSPDDCDCLYNLIRCQKLIISRCNKNDFEEMNEFISISKILLKQLKNESLVLGKIFLYPSLSYFYYKINNYRLANYYINNTIKFDDLLTDKFPILHLHKLHHIVNKHKILVKNKKYTECANLFFNVFNYLISSKEIPKCGKFNTLLLNNLYEVVPLEIIFDGFSRSYLVCILENSEVEKAFLKNMLFQNYSMYKDHKNKYIVAFINYHSIQKYLFNNVIQYKKILKFFKENDYYHFDTYKLLIIKKLFYMTNNNNIKNILIDIVREKLNFKEPENLINSFF